tara:strand:+ start:1197 stop:1451 length:255 start_codon:yes stop_codon:yes gene_type:complete
MLHCDWCEDEIEKGQNNISDDGDNCCSGCIHKANENAKPIKESNDINYLDRDELIDLVFNMSLWGGQYNKDDLNKMVLNYRRNN